MPSTYLPSPFLINQESTETNWTRSPLPSLVGVMGQHPHLSSLGFLSAFHSIIPGPTHRAASQSVSGPLANVEDKFQKVSEGWKKGQSVEVGGEEMVELAPEPRVGGKLKRNNAPPPS